MLSRRLRRWPASSADTWIRPTQAPFSAAVESLNARRGIPQNEIGSPSSAVADAQPDDFGRTAEKETPLREIRVFADDSEVIYLCVLPDLDVGGAAKAAIPEVDRTGVEIAKGRRQTGRQVLVKQEFHNETISNLRSVSAAKARQARMSASVRSGKSARISSRSEERRVGKECRSGWS